MINSLNIVINDSDFIEGSNNIKIQDINQITNGFVNNIVCYSLDSVSSESRNALFVELFKKLSPGGSLTVRFLNTFLLAKKIKNSNINGETFSRVVGNIRSAWMEGDLSGVLSSIENCQLNKLYSEDIYSIAVIEKNK
jgi:phospholipid N-methyltransferase